MSFISKVKFCALVTWMALMPEVAFAGSGATAEDGNAVSLFLSLGSGALIFGFGVATIARMSHGDDIMFRRRISRFMVASFIAFVAVLAIFSGMNGAFP